MPNAVSVESKDFVNPDLTWKTVTKGFRSSSRRPRKLARSLNLAGQQGDKSRKREEPSVSRLEKHGLSVHGQHFVGKIEHVPIKKRRLQLRSLSPPSLLPLLHCREALSCQHQTARRQSGDFDQTVDNKHVSVQSYSSDSLSAHVAFSGSVGLELSQNIENACVNGKLSEVSSGKSCYTEDFSGIALLAAAACSNSIIDDAHNVEGAAADELLTLEGTDSSLSAIPSERTTTSSESGTLSPKDLVHEDNAACSVVQDNSVDKRDRVAGKKSTCKKDDRLHWDLNTVMEAWELPCDDINVGSQRNDAGKFSNNNNDAHGDKPQELEGSVKHNGTGHSRADEVFTQVIIKDETLDYSPRSGQDTNSSRMMTDEKMSKPLLYCCKSSTMQLGKMVSEENFQLGKQDAFAIDQAVSEKNGCCIDHSQSKDGSINTFDVPSYGTAPTELVSAVTCQTSDVECSVTKSGKVGSVHPSPEHEQFSFPGTTFVEGQPIDVQKKLDEVQPLVTVNAEKEQDEVQPVLPINLEKKEDDKALAVDTTPKKSTLQVEPNEQEPKSCEHFDKVASHNPVDDGYGSDVSRGNHDLAVDIEELAEIEVDYESPFEDGELRESAAYSWEGNEVEGETEFVDCDSGNRDRDDFDATDHCASGVGSASFHNDNIGSSATVQCGTVDVPKEASSKRISGQDALSGSFECSLNKVDEGNNDDVQNVLASDSMHGLDVQGASISEFASKPTTRKMSSRIEGKPCADALHKEDDVYGQHDRSAHDSFFQAGRTIDSEKNLGMARSNTQVQDGSKGEVHRPYSPASYVESRNHYQSGYPQDTRHPKMDRLTYRGHRRPSNYSSKGVFRPLTRRRFPDDSDDGYSVDRRMGAGIDNNHVRSRVRSGIYRQGINMGREEYHVPISDDSASSFIHLPRNLSRRERSFSPVFRRGGNFSRPHRKSRSRSRSRSPPTWHWQRERNMAAGRISRSPHMWPEGRRERIRMPFQKINFEVDYEDVMMSSPKGSRFSPDCRSRWFDDQNGMADPFEEGKLSGRLFRRVPRFDSGDTSGRRKSDDCLRSTARPGRFHRGYQYIGNASERPKYRNNYEPFDQMRHRDSSDRVRRFRYDAEDCFEAHNAQNEDSGYIRGADRRDITRSAREERGPFRYNRERTNPIGPKLSGIGDGDENGSPSG